MSTFTNTTNTIARWLAAVGITAMVAAGAVSPALAQPGADFQDQGIREMNGVPRFGEPAWHSGASALARATKNAHHTRAYDARAAHAEARQPGGGRYFAHGAVDDPPGSAYQTFGSDQSNGLVR
jgi:hypothetical protein